MEVLIGISGGVGVWREPEVALAVVDEVDADEVQVKSQTPCIRHHIESDELQLGTVNMALMPFPGSNQSTATDVRGDEGLRNRDSTKLEEWYEAAAYLLSFRFLVPKKRCGQVTSSSIANNHSRDTLSAFTLHRSVPPTCQYHDKPCTTILVLRPTSHVLCSGDKAV